MKGPLAITLLSSLLIAACGGAPKEPATPDGSNAVAPPTAPPTAEAPVASAAPAEVAPAPVRKQRPLEIHNSCAEVATLVFGEDPKAPTAGKRTLASGSSIDGPRDDAGNVTIWLLDGEGAPLVKVNVTRGMKRVDVGKSCRSLDAR